MPGEKGRACLSLACVLGNADDHCFDCIMQLAAPSQPAALHAVVMSFDGYLYMIDGASGAHFALQL